jgi:cobalt-zinc-cadmium efflux system outer membrane protein
MSVLRLLHFSRLTRRAIVILSCVASSVSLASAQNASAQTSVYTWQQVKARFEANNPTLQAGKLNVDESRAEEVTANLRPNPTLDVALDQFNFYPLRPFAYADQIVGISYLHERQHKRELRREAAEDATAVAASQQVDLERNLLFNLRSAFVQLLQAKAVLDNAVENLKYYDKELEVQRIRLKDGDIAPVDEDRLELQRVTFESDFENATVSVRTAKIQLLTLLNDRTPIEKFDISGDFDFTEQIPALEPLRATALEARPDLRAAVQSIDEAVANHKLAIANGSADPVFGIDAGRNPPEFAYVGASLSIPLRIFDKNQGEKLRTQIDIDHNRRLAEASRAQVFSDVDSAYATINSTLNLLRPYKSNYLPRAAKVRDTVSYAYKRGAATLLDFLDAQKSYRDVNLAYLNLIGSFLMSATQLNLAVGQEAIQ